MSEAKEAILAINQAPESENGWFSRFEAHMLKILGFKSKIWKTQFDRLTVVAMTYNFQQRFLVIKVIFWAWYLKLFLLRNWILWPPFVFPWGVNLGDADRVKWSFLDSNQFFIKKHPYWSTKIQKVLGKRRLKT